MNAPLDWRHLDYSEPAAVRWLREESGLETVVIDALTAEDTRPRAVTGATGILVILRGVNLNPGSGIEDMISIRLWLERGRVISTSRRRLRSVTELREEADAGQGPKSAGEFLNQLVSRLGDFIDDAIEQIEGSLEQAEDRNSDPTLFARNSPFSLLRRQTARIRRYLAPQREALDYLTRAKDPVFEDADRIGFREQVNRLTLTLEDLDLVRERAMVAQEEFLGTQAHEQNTRMLLLSIVAAVFLPLSFLTGLMGMNVAGLPGLENPMAFWILVLAMVLITGVILLLFRAKKWL
jgi:zinc transporter